MIRSMMGRKKVDRNTLLLLHFDGSLKDEASGKPYVGSNMSYVADTSTIVTTDGKIYKMKSEKLCFTFILLYIWDTLSETCASSLSISYLSGNIKANEEY